jgi:predicted DNA-binding transcriptional regulator AlpA
MTRKIKEAERAKLPLESALKSAPDLNGRDRLLTPKEAADLLRLSTSWLAKARMRGDGPPYVKPGGSVRYLESTLVRWLKVQQRLSTSQG